MICSIFFVSLQTPKQEFKTYPRPKSISLQMVGQNAKQIAKTFEANVKGEPQVVWEDTGNSFRSVWPNLVVSFYGNPLQPKMYLDSSIKSGFRPSSRWFGDESFVKKNPWTTTAFANAVPDATLRSELIPDIRNVRNRYSRPTLGGVIEIRWTLRKKLGYEFAHWGLPGVTMKFDASSRKVVSVHWQLAYTLAPIRKMATLTAASRKASSLFSAYLRRYAKAPVDSRKIRLELRWVWPNGDRIYPDGHVLWGSTQPIHDLRRYQLAYIGTYDNQTMIWLDASTLDPIGGWVNPSDLRSESKR